MPTYKQLNQSYSDRDDLSQQKLDLLFHGGSKIQKKASIFLPKLNQEQQTTYTNRLEFASYCNYMSEIINDFVATTCSQSISVLPAGDAGDDSTPGELPKLDEFYRLFAQDSDLRGHSLTQVMSHLLETALHNQNGIAWQGVDIPKQSIQGLSQAQVDQLGTNRPYVYDIPWQTIRNYKLDEFGNLVWIVLRDDLKPQLSPLDLVDSTQINFIVWTLTNEGKGKRDVFSKTYKDTEAPNDEDEFGSPTETDLTGFLGIPIRCMHIPAGLRIGANLFAPQIEHFRTKSSYDYALFRNASPIPVYKQGNDLEQVGNVIAEQVNRAESFRADMQNKGMVVITSEDSIEMVEALGSSLALMAQSLTDISDEIHSISKQMATSISASSGSGNAAASGKAKVQDNKAKELICSQYGLCIRDHVKGIYSLLSQSKGDTNVVWNVQGLSDYRIIESDEVIAKATSTSLMPILNYSKTLKKEFFKDIAIELAPDCDKQTQFTIAQEISDSVDSEPSEQDTLSMLNTPPEDDKEQDGKSSNTSKKKDNSKASAN